MDSMGNCVGSQEGIGSGNEEDRRGLIRDTVGGRNERPCGWIAWDGGVRTREEPFFFPFYSFYITPRITLS